MLQVLMCFVRFINRKFRETIRTSFIMFSFLTLEAVNWPELLHSILIHVILQSGG